MSLTSSAAQFPHVPSYRDRQTSSRSASGRAWYRRRRISALVRHNPPGWSPCPGCISVWDRSTKTRRKLTLINARITLTEAKRPLAGVILETSFARFKASMPAFKAEIAPSRPLGCWDSTFMIEIRGSHERAVLEGFEPERQTCRDTPRARARLRRR